MPDAADTVRAVIDQALIFGNHFLCRFLMHLICNRPTVHLILCEVLVSFIFLSFLEQIISSYRKQTRRSALTFFRTGCDLSRQYAAAKFHLLMLNTPLTPANDYHNTSQVSRDSALLLNEHCVE